MTAEYSSLEQDLRLEDSCWRRKLGSFFETWYSRVLVFCLLLLGILLLLWILVPEGSQEAEKQGAGLLFISDRKLLLLLRNSQHNHETWGLPGGNSEPEDVDLLATAIREANEELGNLPAYDIVTQIKTKRGKRQQKHYAVFVCNVTEEFEPVLNVEHSSFQWFDVGDAAKLANLHPVVSILFKEPARKHLAAAISANPQYLPGRPVEKRGAGLFLMSEKEILLLTRNSSHNNATLSVPGGNVDLDDTHLLATAKREAEEEMGSCPDFDYKGEVDTKRGKHDQKEFKLFLGTVAPEVKAGFHPVLSPESLDWGWYPFEELAQPRKDLHPVVEILMTDHLEEVKSLFGL